MSEQGEQSTAPAAPLGENEVMVGENRVRLGRPKSVAQALEVLALMDSTPVHGFGAALGMCWICGPSVGAPRARPKHFRNSMYEFGGAVVDELMARGIGQQALLDAGTVASRILLQMVPPEKEVKQAEGFSGPPEGGST